MVYLTPDAKTKLSSTIRILRDRLLTDLHNAAESAYRLSLTLAKAGLAEEQQIKRQRLEQWLEEQVRAEAAGKKLKDEQRLEIKERHLRSAEKLAAATLLNRLIVILQMEAIGLSKPVVVTTEYFNVMGTLQVTSSAPSVELTPSSTPIMEWHERFEDTGVRQVFLHLQQHGSITEIELTQMLGSARLVRRFSMEFEEHLQKVPFPVKIETTANGKRYVRQN